MANEKRVASEVRAIREEYAEEEAEAAELEATGNAAALDVPLSLRITKDLDRALRTRAAEDQIPVSALVRRLLGRAVQDRPEEPLTVEQVEQIARRVVEESGLRS